VLALALGAACAGTTTRPAAPGAAVLAADSAAARACGVAVVAPAGSAAMAPRLPAATFDSAWSIISRTYWDTTFNGVNWRGVRDELRPRAAAAPSTAALRAVLGEMVGRLGQSHFAILPREAVVAPAAGTGGPARAVGDIGVSVRRVEGRVAVTAVRAGGPADGAGVRPGWIVERVDGCPVSALLRRIPATLDARHAALQAYSAVAGRLRGAAGDTADVTFLDGGERSTRVRIARAPEPGTTVRFGNLPPLNAHLESERRTLPGGRTVGIIRLNIWMPVLAAEFDAAIDRLRDADGIVVDVRGNFGGVGGMVMGIAGHFLTEPLVLGTMKSRTNEMRFVANPRRSSRDGRPVAPYAGPLAVLIDPLSISTSEIFAAGLQGVRRARVFGETSAGQALPSISEELPNGDMLYHAIADFLAPGGQRVEGPGVTPDVAVRLTRAALLRGGDPTLDAALLWLSAPRN
jgi:carboxyl-terminal processing protease